MKKFIIYLSIIGSIYCQTIGTTSDGKTVIINEDGTWEIVAEDYSILLENEKKYITTGGNYVDYFKFLESSFKKDLGHIILTDGSIEFPLLEYHEYFNYLHGFTNSTSEKLLDNDGYEYSMISDISFRFFDFEDDGTNEIIIKGSYRTAGYSGFFNIFGKVGNTNTYRQTLDFNSSGWFGLDYDNKLFYSTHGAVDYIICGACGYQSGSPQRKGESSREFNRRIKKDPLARFSSLYPNYVLAPQVNIAYRDGEMFHPKQSFAKNTEYFDVITFISDEINWARMEKVKTENYDKWSDYTLIDSKEYSYYFFNDDGTYDTLGDILVKWYRPLIQNIMAYHYNSMKTGTYPDNKINLNNTKRIFYDVYKAPDVDKRWEELIGLLKLYPYKKL